MIPDLTLSALENGFGHFGVASNNNKTRHVDTLGVNVDSKNSTSNTYSIDIDGEFPEGATFNFIMSIANLKILPGDYKVDVSSKLITQWSHKELNVKYWIALEKSSTYGV